MKACRWASKNIMWRPPRLQWIGLSVSDIIWLCDIVQLISHGRMWRIHLVLLISVDLRARYKQFNLDFKYLWERQVLSQWCIWRNLDNMFSNLFKPHGAMDRTSIKQIFKVQPSCFNQQMMLPQISASFSKKMKMLYIASLCARMCYNASHSHLLWTWSPPPKTSVWLMRLMEFDAWENRIKPNIQIIDSILWLMHLSSVTCQLLRLIPGLPIVSAPIQYLCKRKLFPVLGELEQGSGDYTFKLCRWEARRGELWSPLGSIHTSGQWQEF